MFNYKKQSNHTLFLILFCLAAAFILGGCAGLKSFSTAGLPSAEVTALRTEQEVLQVNPKSPEAARAQFRIGNILARNAMYTQALQELLEVPQKYPDSPWRSNALFVAAQVYEAQHNYVQAFQTYRQVMDLGIGQHPPYAEKGARQLVLDHLSKEEIRGLQQHEPAGPLTVAFSFRLLKLTYLEGNFDQAGAAAKDFVSKWPQDQFTPEVQIILQDSLGKVLIFKNKIGFLAPLSGTYGDYGNNIKRGVDLAFKEHNQKVLVTDQAFIVAKDTKGSAQECLEQTKQLINEEKVVALIGPALSGEVQQVAALVNEQKVPLITPSADKGGLTVLGPYIFRNSLTPDREARAMAEYAVLEKHYHKMAVLYPNTSYGNAMSKSFSDRVQELKGEVTVSSPFEADETDFKKELIDLGGADPRIIKDAEVQQREDLENKTKKIVDAVTKIMPSYMLVTPTGMAMSVTQLPKIAVVDFEEQGDEAIKDGMGGRFMEKIVNALGKKNRFTILTGKKIIEQGPADYVIKGQIIQRVTVTAVSGGTDEYFKFDVNLQLEKWSDTLSIGGPAALTIAATAKLTAVPLPIVASGIGTTAIVKIIAVTPLTATASLAASFPESSRVLLLSEGLRKHKPLEENPNKLEAVYLVGSPREITAFTAQLLFYDLKLPLLGTDVWHSGKIWRDGQENEEGAVYPAGFYLDNPDPEVQVFIKNFQREYGEQPTVLAAQGYEAAQLMLAALGGKTREEVQLALTKIQGFKGICGATSFTPEREANKPVLLLTIKDGKEVLLKSF